MSIRKMSCSGFTQYSSFIPWLVWITAEHFMKKRYLGLNLKMTLTLRWHKPFDIKRRSWALTWTIILEVLQRQQLSLPLVRVTGTLLIFYWMMLTVWVMSGPCSHVSTSIQATVSPQKVLVSSANLTQVWGVMSCNIWVLFYLSTYTKIKT